MRLLSFLGVLVYRINEVALFIQFFFVHILALVQVCAECRMVIHLGLVLGIGKAGGKLKNTLPRVGGVRLGAVTPEDDMPIRQGVVLICSTQLKN